MNEVRYLHAIFAVISNIDIKGLESVLSKRGSIPRVGKTEKTRTYK